MINTISSPSGICNQFTETKAPKTPEYKTSVQKFARETESFTSKDNSHKLTIQIDKFLKTYVLQRQGIHPRRFCRRWFGLEALGHNGQPRYTEEQILAMESEYGYREKCINLIARILKIKPNTIQRWGKGVEFDKIPSDKREQYEVYLGYVDSLKVITHNITRVNEDILLKLSRELEV